HNEPFQATLESRHPIEQLGLQRLDREQRNQADHRPHFHWQAAAVRKVEDVIVEAVFVVPQLNAFLVHVVYCVSDVEEMLPKLASSVLIGRVIAREFERDRHQIETVHPHPAGAVRLFDEPAGWQRSASIKYADVVEAKEPALEDVPALRILAVDPPREVEQQL